MSWTSDRVKKLKKLWGRGMSASEVADSLGGVSRNAVIGKVHRQGFTKLSEDGQGKEATKTKPKKTAAAKKTTQKKPAATKKTTAAKKTTATKKPTAAKKSAAAKKTTAAKKTAATKKTTTTKKTAATKKPTTAKKSAAAKKRPSKAKTPKSAASKRTAKPAAATTTEEPAFERVAPVIRDASQPRAPGPPTPEEVAARATLAEIEKLAKNLTLLELTERTCKWPIGDPAKENFSFCGLPCADSKPYCEHHIAIAFQPMSPRRDRSRANRSP